MTLAYPPWAQTRQDWTWIALGVAVAVLAVYVWKKRVGLLTKITGKVQIINITGQLPKHPGKQFGSRPLSKIEFAVVHHSVWPGDGKNNGTPEKIAADHIKDRNFPGIGYHFLITKDGTVYQTNELTTTSYHVVGFNERSIGICLAGRYHIDTPPDVQVEAVIMLIRQLNEQLGRKLQVKGHGELQSKDCPGKNVNVRYIEDQI